MAYASSPWRNSDGRRAACQTVPERANQAVRIPREFELPGEDALMRKEGERLIIEPAPSRSLLAVLAALPTLDEDFAPIADAPAGPVEL